MDENEKINQNKLICDICNCPDKYFLCNSCFEEYNNIYKEKKDNFVKSENAMSGKIRDLLICNKEKIKTLNKKILCDRYKKVLLDRQKQEEELIKKCEEELKKYENLNKEQEIENNKLKTKLLEDNTEESTNLFESAVNLNNNNIAINDNENKDINDIKKEIEKINLEIINYKKKYIYDLFEETFIKKKTIIKITDFFNIITDEPEKKETNENFSILGIPDKLSKEIKMEVLKGNSEKSDIYLKRFNSFFNSMVSFLEEVYKRFKLQMPYKINYPKIKYKDFEYKIKLEKKELNDNSIVNAAVDGYHLLNINYEYLVNFIFGDEIKLKYIFDLSFFIKNKVEDLGSLKKIEEESKINQGTNECDGFVLVDFP